MKFPLLLDGGLSYVLEEKGCDLNHKLWSANLLESKPEAIVDAHLAYLRAGAQCIISSTYQASIQGYLDLGYNTEEAKTLILRSIELAEKALSIYKDGSPENRTKIAASIGSYGAYLADGSEYYGNYGMSKEQLKSFHHSRIQLLDHSNADFFACETIPSFLEAEVFCDLFKETQKPAWISFSCKDEKHICDGSPIELCTELLKDKKNIFAIGVNCTHPKFISPLLKRIKSTCGDLKIAIYPNSGEAYNVETKTWISLSKADKFEYVVKEWLDLGADIIGGCCGVGPAHIKNIGQFLSKNYPPQ